MPQSLREKTLSGLSNEEKCDILLSLINRVDRGEYVGFEPEDILLDDDNLIIDSSTSNAGSADEENRNLLLTPPEFIRDVSAGRNPVMEPPQSWFLLGMIAYYMYYKKNYYLQNDVSVLDIEQHIRHRQTVIQPNEARNIPFATAVAQMTAVNPAAREAGISAFLQYLSERMPCTIHIRFLCEGRVVAERDVGPIQEDVEDLEPSGQFLLNGVRYYPVTSPISVLYRPGRHSLNVELTRLAPARNWNPLR